MSAQTTLQNFRPALLTYAYRLLGNADLAADLVQDALVKACERLAQGEQPRDMRAWLYRVTHNLAVDRLRRPRRERPLSTGEFEAVWAGDERADTFAQIEREVRALPSPYLEAIVLRYLQHLTYEEIAEVLDCPIGTVKANVARGLEKLRRKIRGSTP